MAKSSFAALAAASVVFVLACEQAPTSVDVQTPPDIQAAVMLVDDHFRFPTIRPFDNPCTGETIVFAGTEHLLVRIWDTDGNGFPGPGDRMRIHFQVNLKGTDSNGVTYQLIDVNNATGVAQVSPWTWSWVHRVISSTGADNFMVKSRLTVNANQVATVHWEDLQKCVG
jgi:hypothetical protein